MQIWAMAVGGQRCTIRLNCFLILAASVEDGKKGESLWFWARVLSSMNGPMFLGLEDGVGLE